MAAQVRREWGLTAQCTAVAEVLLWFRSGSKWQRCRIRVRVRVFGVSHHGQS